MYVAVRSAAIPHDDRMTRALHQVKAPYESDEERVQDMLVFMTAGHDTTAGTLTLALMDLAQDPVTLARVQVRSTFHRVVFYVSGPHRAEFEY